MKPEIRQKEIEHAQNEWGKSVVKIGKLYAENDDFKTAALLHIERFYGYREGPVLFKPTIVSLYQFRLTTESALSYFIGGNPAFPRDMGFALQPWKKVRFENAGFIFQGKNALAMGNYFFKDISGKELKVEYSFGYFLTHDENLKINLHHSSLPYLSIIGQS